KKYMAVVGLRLKRELQGISMLDLDEVQPKKSIATTRTFETNYKEWEQVSERITTFAVSCSEKLRQQHSCCNALMVFIVTNWNRKDLPQYARNIVMPLPYPTHSSIELSKFANFALSKIFKKGYAYKKAGVIVLDLSPEETLQTTLFETRNCRHIPLMQAVDKMNSRYGQQKIRLAAQDQQRIWKMKQEKLSPQYTTKISDVMKVKCEK
ncbi:MAG: DUF4113 domain-containing protein, partial [Bacteroidales bacterium]|nr:DUF4113 domain-containing protein [Bacteroidales bacterium]